MADQFDLVVLGGGPGGYAAALYAASAGVSVAIVEELALGGTCLNRGCIPAKELLQTAEVLRTLRGASEFGISTSEPVLDLSVSQARKQSVVDRLVGGVTTLLSGRDVTIVEDRGVMIAAGTPTVRCSEGREITGTNVIVATGSAPRSIPGLDFDGDRVLSSDHVLDITEVPPRVAVIGGGAIGCEFASFLADVGSDVTILEALPQILTGVDRQVTQTVQRAFKKRGITIHTDIEVTGLDHSAADLGVSYRGSTGDERVLVDQVVESVGRRPSSEEIGLAEIGVAVDDRGYITVDPQMRTTVDGIWAVGDVVATPQLAHVAFAEAIVAVKAMLGEDPLPVDYDRVPWGIYCHPEVAFCGLTEEEATERGLDIETSVHRFGGNGRALIIGEPDGVMKIVAEKDGPIVGVHIAGPWATELIAEGYLSVNWEATAADVGALIHAHPTLSELFGESALAMGGRSLHG